MPPWRAWARRAKWVSSHCSAAVATVAQTAPSSPQNQTPATAIGTPPIPAHTFIAVMVRNASRPASAPVCAPPRVAKTSPVAAIRRGPASWGASMTWTASHGARTHRAAVARTPVLAAVKEERARTRPARSGSFTRSSATYRVAVNAQPQSRECLERQDCRREDAELPVPGLPEDPGRDDGGRERQGPCQDRPRKRPEGPVREAIAQVGGLEALDGLPDGPRNPGMQRDPPQQRPFTPGPAVPSLNRALEVPLPGAGRGHPRSSGWHGHRRRRRPSSPSAGRSPRREEGDASIRR